VETRTKSARTKEAIAETLGTLLKGKPLAKISIREIAERSGLDRQTFYYHFDTRDDAMQFLCRLKLSSITAGLDGSQNLRETLDAILKHLDEDIEFFRLLLDSVGRDTLKTYIYDSTSRFANRITGEAFRGHSIPGSTMRFIAEYCLTATISTIEHWIQAENRMPREELASLLCQSIEWYADGVKRTFP